MFTGWTVHNLDAKGRLAIPVAFRDQLKAMGDSRLVITTAEACLVAYPYPEWQKLAEWVAALPALHADAQRFRRFYISGATECNCDKQGRVLIPQALRDFAGFSGPVLVAGMQSTFELWDKDRFYEERQSIQGNFSQLSSTVAEMGK